MTSREGRREYRTMIRGVSRTASKKFKYPQSFLIVCEGEKTEPNYFTAFRTQLNSVLVEIVGSGTNTVTTVKETIRLKESYRDEPFDQYWCVFDKDSFSVQQVNEAYRLAEKFGIKVAFSNECFEIWYLLHFHYYNSGMSRTQYAEKLEKELGVKYQKNDETMYAKLKPRQVDAIRNAVKLKDSYETFDPARNNPYTTVHELVQELNRYLS